MSEVWTRQPSAIFAVGRDLGPQSEQLVGLENDTAVRGDNVLLMRAHRRASPKQRVPRLEEFLRISAPFQTPFAPPIENELRQSEDRAGIFLWTEKIVSGGTRCVLVMRRLDRADALLRPEFTALDVVLRNCVDGDAKTAMAPAGAERIAAANVGLPRAPARSISHLAGPRRAIAASARPEALE